MRIVLIDDDAIPMNYYVHALRYLGFEVVHFLDIEAAKRDILSRVPDLVILDIMMPPPVEYEDRDTEGGIFTGLFLVDDLRSHYPALPIIVLTNLSDAHTRGELIRDRLRVIQKNEFPPRDFADEVVRFFGSLGA
jgi:CheY-like chemotaxis protein